MTGEGAHTLAHLLLDQQDFGAAAVVQGLLSEAAAALDMLFSMQ